MKHFAGMIRSLLLFSLLLSRQSLAPRLGFAGGTFGPQDSEEEWQRLRPPSEVQGAASGHCAKAKANRGGLEQGTLPAIRCDTEVFIG